jgi:hypothetical protein
VVGAVFCEHAQLGARWILICDRVEFW